MTPSHPGSYLSWLPLSDESRADRVVKVLMDSHISVSTAEPFCTSQTIPQAIRVALAFWVQTRYQRFTTPTRAILIYNLEPVFSAIFAVWLLHEILHARVLLGGSLILLGMCLPGIFAAVVHNRRKRGNDSVSDYTGEH